ncbi:MAG: ExeM/NucH family extracellular endonuclease, partial [Acidimicrobiia bacterium]|nr:ExeM/NucH family extracellular endonuclease [Acidimicrobiia bacterium]
APYTNDFIELFNRGTTTVSLAGWSVQYASATGTGNFGAADNQITLLSGSLAPGQYTLVQEASGGANGSALPTPDVTDLGPINMSGTAGKVALVTSTSGLGCNGGSTPCTAAQVALIKDLVGYGAANFSETAPAPTTSNTTAVVRGGNGCTETDNNAEDFAAAAPSPRNTASPLSPCAAPAADPVINEFSASTAGSDVEFVEIIGDPNTDYSTYTILEIEGDSGTATGTVDEVIAMGSTGAGGLHLVSLPANALENGTVTLLLVKNFTGAVNTDLDSDNNGTFDSTPWDAVVDAVAVNDGGAGDLTYGTPVLGVAYDGLVFAPGGASRIPDGADTDSTADWVRNDFDLAGIMGFTGTPIVGEAYNTPGEPNQVVTPALVINEIDYDQPGTDAAEFVELRNNGGTALDLDAFTLELVNGNGTVVYDTIDLPAVSLAAGDYYVVCANAATVANCDLDDGPDTNFIQNGAPDAVALRHGGDVIDTVSYEGDTGAPYTEGSGSGLEDNGAAASESISRCPDGADTDQNNTDLSVRASTPGMANDCVVDGPPTVVSTTPSNGQPDASVGGNVVIDFNEPVTVVGTWFEITCDTSGTHTATVSGGPASYTLDPDTDFTSGDSCTVTVFATQVTDQDGTPDPMTADYVFGFTALDVCADTFTPAYAIQGSGAAAAITGLVTTQGVVVGDHEGPSPALRGFYIQDLSGDGDPATSDGLFVFNGNNDNVALGDVVRVTGTAGEFQDQTQVTATGVVACGTGTVTPTDVTLPFPDAAYPERYEGMLVRMPQALYVTEHFQLGRFGQVVMSSGGRLAQPTNVVAPGAPALALQSANNLNKIIFDDALQNQNPDPIAFGRGGNPLSASNTLRGGDTATGTVGVMTYTWSGNAASGNAFRLRPIGALGGNVNFQAANQRPPTPPDVGGRLKVVGMNQLNFFNTFQGCTNGVGGAPTDCRGANSQAEFDRQWPKTVAAIVAMDPDVLGVNEVENDGYGPSSAMQFLVDKLNDATAPGTYALLDVDSATGEANALGLDAIKVGVIYQPASVTPAGQTAALNTTAFVNGGDGAPRNRASLLQAFEETDTGARFLVNVNHLKSKGSACDAPDAGDGQGNCNQVRVNAVNELLSWFATDPTGTGESDILMIGDYNSYAKEDPITALLSGGFTNLVLDRLGADAYSYVFDGQWGYLDQALASTSMDAQVTGVADYHINADEPSVLDYNTEFKTPGQIASLYAVDQYRTSDHDPVIVGLELNAAPAVEVSPANQSVQYSDPISDVEITATDVAGDLPLVIDTEWSVDGGAFTTGLPSGIELADDGCGAVSCGWTLSGYALVAPGTYVIRITVEDGNGDSTSADITITVTQEDARATYTGALYVSTASTSSGSAQVTLAATVQDISTTSDAGADTAPGDIRNATVTFIDRDTGTPIAGCTDLPIGLANPGDVSTGTATCQWNVTINGDGQAFTVGIVVDDHYTRNASTDDVVVMVAKPLASNFISGGGFILLNGSAGAVAGDDGTKANFGFSVKFNKSGKNLQGSVNIIVRRTEADGVVHTYQMKATALTSLAIQTGDGTATFNSKANIQDITDPLNPVSVGGNATLQLTLDDNGDPGSADTIGITVWDKDGGMWFSSRFDGVKTVSQTLDGGNVRVR